MNKKFKSVLLSTILCSMATLSTNVFAVNCSNGASLLTPTEFSVPSGYLLQSKNDGICIYKGSNNVYIQVVDLAGGANVKFATEADGGFSNTVPKYELYYKNGIDDYFANGQSKNSNFFSVINAQFFDMNKDPTFLSFPVKSNGNIILIGPDMRLNERASTDFRTLQIFDQSSSWPAGIKRAAKSVPYYNKSQYDKLSGKLIVGFAPYVNYGTRKYQSLGRTFVAPVGGMSTPSNGEYPILIFAFAQAKTQAQMTSVMKKWGAYDESIIMFDGSHSTQYKDVNGLKVTGQYRPVPMVFETYTH